MAPGVPVLLSIAVAVAQAADPLLVRLVEEAEVFAQAIETVVGEEVLRQRVVKSKGPRLRIGEAALREDPIEYQERELRSEFGYARIQAQASDPGNFHEARQVIEVNGRPVQAREKARRRLVMGLRSSDDEVKKRLLEDLERHGLRGGATDFSLCLLLFRQRAVKDYEWQRAGTERLGADAAAVFTFRQRQGDQAMTVFQGKQAVRQSLSGQVWIRIEDGVPLKIRWVAALPDPPHEPIVDLGEVEYTRGSSLVTLPVAALHRRTRGPLLLAEETFRYKGFKRFSSDSEIKFTPVDEPPPEAVSTHSAPLAVPPAAATPPSAAPSVKGPTVTEDPDGTVVHGVPFHPGVPVGPGLPPRPSATPPAAAPAKP